MNVQRTKVQLKRMSKEDDSFVALPPQKCVEFMWELTAEVWSLQKSPYVEQRLPRHITKLIKA